MKYSCSIEINLPRDKMIAIFEDSDNMGKWQDGFVSFSHFDGIEGRAGAKSKIKYKMGKREIEMVETIQSIDMPHHLNATYEAKGVWNSVENTFSDTESGGTHWHIDTEFRCSGFLRVMALLMPGMFKKQTKKMMVDFKTYAEALP